MNPAELAQQVDRVLAQYQIARESICKIASIDLKMHERAICQLAETWKVPFVTFSAETLLQMPGAYALSDFVNRQPVSEMSVNVRQWLRWKNRKERIRNGFAESRQETV